MRPYPSLSISLLLLACLWAGAVVHAAAAGSCIWDPSVAADVEVGPLSMATAIAMAVAHNPDLIAADCRIAAAEARILQAGLRLNPQMSLEVENFAGSGIRSGTESAESSLALSQLVELGGKRAKRIRLAGLNRDLETWTTEAKRLDTITATRKAFVAVVAAQRRTELAAELTKLADEGVRVVTARIEAGQVSPVEKTRAQMAATRTRIESRHAEAELAAARARLAAQWGADALSFDHADLNLGVVKPPPAYNQLATTLDANPDVARWASEIERQHARQQLAEARRLPDITVGGGIRHFADEGDIGLLASVSVPLPLFDRGQGDIAEARFQALAAEAEQTASRVRVRSSLQDAYQQMKAAFAEVRITRDDILPAATSSFDAVTTGYRHGKFAYIEVLDAQRTLFDARVEYLRALARYHEATADVERLTGTSLNQAETVPYDSNGESKP